MLTFTYDDSYRHGNNAIPISTSMPLDQRDYIGQVVTSFFSDLLPDEQVRIRLARYLGLSARNTFALLREIGGDCGALSLFPEGGSPLSQSKYAQRIVNSFLHTFWGSNRI
ncbi:MAG: HipA N-terminal domain-containing protein [Alphaproteobacteria bacterium]|nr:HipA N-terminal domain-containing protein [Alphaproteobacteria bacterium]